MFELLVSSSKSSTKQYHWLTDEQNCNRMTDILLKSYRLSSQWSSDTNRRSIGTGGQSLSIRTCERWGESPLSALVFVTIWTPLESGKVRWKRSWTRRISSFGLVYEWACMLMDIHGLQVDTQQRQPRSILDAKTGVWLHPIAY